MNALAPAPAPLAAATGPAASGPGAFVGETLAQFGRWMHHLKREPFNIMFTLVQPVLWMVFFGSLMQRVSFPGLEDVPYRTFFTAGVLTFTVYGNAMSGGIPMLFDRENGFLTRLMAAPIHRGSILAGRFLYVELVALGQTLVILAIAALMGVTIATGWLGVLGILLYGALLGLGLTSLSLALAFVLRGHGSFFMILGTVGLPLLFCSTALAPLSQMPTWMQVVAQCNPLSYCVDAMRALVLDHRMFPATFGHFAWSLLGLVVFNVVALWVSLRALRRRLA
jgi:ABC-2 type transport system permease protein